MLRSQITRIEHDHIDLLFAPGKETGSNQMRNLETRGGGQHQDVEIPAPGHRIGAGYHLNKSGKIEGRPEGAKRPTAGDEPREFTSRGEGGRVPPFFE